MQALIAHHSSVKVCVEIPNRTSHVVILLAWRCSSSLPVLNRRGRRRRDPWALLSPNYDSLTTSCTFRLALFESGSGGSNRRILKNSFQRRLEYDGYWRRGSAGLRVKMRIPPVSNWILLFFLMTFHRSVVALNVTNVSPPLTQEVSMGRCCGIFFV